jgi:hypothetical protein
MKIFNYGQFVNENQLDLFSGSGTEWDSQKGIASKVVDPQIQDQPVEIELSGTQSGTQSEVQNVVDSEKIEICAQIAKQGTFLYTDLGFQSAIQLELDKMATEIDYNPLRQDVLKILYDSGKYDRDRYRYITLTNGYYESARLKVKQVLDKSGNYDPVNKLNTNWSDIAELIYDIIDKDDKSKELKGLNYYKMKDYLSKYFSEKELGPLLIGFDLRKYIINNRIKSSIGEEAENFVKECFDKKGMKCVFQGGDGDPVDMSYGIDLIMHNLKSGKYYLVQVKSDPVAALKASGEWRYSSLDFYCAPIIDEGVRKTILYTKENKKGVMFDNITPRKSK